MPEENESSLERIRSRLYANEAPAPLTPPPLSPRYVPMTQAELQNQDQTIQPAWAPPPPPKRKVKKDFSWTVLFLGISLLFFLVAGGISFFFLIRGGLSVSSNNIVMTIQGPNTIASGATVPLVITIENKNPVAISGTDIAVAFPDGTRSADDVTQPLIRYADTLGTIPAGGTVTRTVQAVLFGSVNQSISIPVTFQYNTANSNALFVKQDNYLSTITSSPLSITAQSTGTVASGEPFTIMLTVRSNATSPLNAIAVSAQYPSGFTEQKVLINGTQVQDSSENPLFVLGTLAAGEQKVISITGVLSGSDNDQRSFGFTVGTQSTDDTQSLAVAYASQTTNISISKPFLAVSLSLNHGDTDPTVVIAGQQIAGLLTWVNSLTTTLSNAQIAIAFSGNALNPSSVATPNGFYNSSTRTLYFSPQTDSSLKLLDPGDTGNGMFSVETLSGAQLNALRNPTINLAVTISGQPTGGSAQTITDTLTNTIQVATGLQLASQIVRTNGPFKNTGTWPPVPNSPTTYTVELAVTNTVNSVGGAVATMILPPYVTYTGEVTPTDGSLSYNSSTNTVTWDVGDVPAGAGSATQPVTAAFQISYTPTDAQAGSSPILVGNQTLTGTDRFTSTQVGNTAQALSTQTPSDPAYSQSFGTVAN